MFGARFRDDWAIQHFLHPMLLNDALEVQQQLEDVTKFQKMDIIFAGTDFDVIWYASLKHAAGCVTHLAM